jgi:hypothetical protein
MAVDDLDKTHMREGRGRLRCGGCHVPGWEEMIKPHT